MKKTLIYLAAFAALFTACTKELEKIENEEPVKEDVQTYTLVAGYPETKTTLSGNVFNWAEGETIAVADGTTTPKVFTISEDADERAAGVFTYTGSLTGDLRLAATPASSASLPAASGSNVTIALPTNYTYVAGQTNAVMVSTAPVLAGGKYTTHFAHAMALIKVSYTNVPIGTKYFKLTMDQNIAGGSVNIDASATPEIKIEDIITTPSKSVTVTLTTAVSVANTSMDFYVPVPTGTYGKFTVQLCDASDNVLSEKNRDMTAAGKSLTLGRADVFATPGITLPTQKVLTFDFKSAVTDWKVGKSNAEAGDFDYTIDEVDYSFNLTKTGNGIYQTDPGSGNPYYLMINSGEILGLPEVSGHRLTKVIVSNSASCSTSAKIGIISNTTTKAYVDDNHATKTLSTTSTDYTFDISSSYVNKRCYIYAADKNTQLYTIKLVYEVSSRSFTPTTLTMSTITCSARTSSSLTFSWTAVEGALGYQVSTDGGSEYGSTQVATSYSWTGISSFTAKTIYVKAIGDGTDYYTSSAGTADGKTKLATPTDLAWTVGIKTVSWTDPNTGAGSYNSVYKYVYSVDDGVSTSDATTSTSAALSITSTTNTKVKAVCLADDTLNSDWATISCTIGEATAESEWSYTATRSDFGSDGYNTTLTTALTLNGKAWTASAGTISGSKASSGYYFATNASNGVQIGASKAYFTYTLSSSAFTGTISEIEVISTNATVSVSVGGTSMTKSGSTFTLATPKSGTIEIVLGEKSSSAIYLKSITINPAD